MNKILRITWGVLTFLTGFICTWVLLKSIYRWLEPIIPPIYGSSKPAILFGYIAFSLLSGLLAGLFAGFVHSLISPWHHKAVLLSPAVLTLLIIFAVNRYIFEFGPRGLQWQFRYVHLQYHLPNDFSMLMVVAGTLGGVIAGQSIKKVVKNKTIVCHASATHDSEIGTLDTRMTIIRKYLILGILCVMICGVGFMVYSLVSGELLLAQALKLSNKARLIHLGIFEQSIE